MSYEAAVAWSVGRSLLAGVFCLWCAQWLRGRGTDGAASGEREPAVHWWQLGPFFMPGLVVGYAYRNALLSLVQSPLLNECLYLAIVVAQLTPVVGLALAWLPPPLRGGSGAYLWRLARRSVRKMSWRQRLGAVLTGELPRQVTAGAIAALLCFQEVEVATLMQARGWPEWIFAKQAGGVELIEVWRFLVLPVVYGLLLIVPVLVYWGWASTLRWVSGPSPEWIPPGGMNLRGRTVVVASWGLVVVWPFISLLVGAVRGRGVIRLRGALWREIGDALVLGGTVTLCLWAILWGVTPLFRRSASRVWLCGCVVMLLPGLLGALSLGLLIFEICQRMGFSPSYSPGPLTGAMCLFLLPRALAMRAMLLRNEGRSGLYLAQQLEPVAGRRGAWGQSMVWQLQDAGRFWTMAILFWWAYLELTLPELLRPSGMAPAPMRLYNLLHYDHRPGLAAMLVVVLAVPVGLVVLVGGLVRRHRPSELKHQSSERHPTEMV